MSVGKRGEDTDTSGGVAVGPLLDGQQRSDHNFHCFFFPNFFLGRLFSHRRDSQIKSLFNPTTVGVQILWVEGGGGFRSPP